MTNPTPAGEHEGLCERLERCARLGYAKSEQDTMREAAALIRTQAAELERLREALETERGWKAEWEAVCMARIKDRARCHASINARDKLIVELIREREAARALSTGKTGDDDGK